MNTTSASKAPARKSAKTVTRRASARKNPSPPSIVKPAVGFIGLGVMGRPMTGHLAKAGYALTVYDVDAKIPRALAKALPDTTAARSPAEVAAASDIIITMLPNGEVVQQVLNGDDGILAGLRRGSLLLDTSSSEPWLTQRSHEQLQAAGASLVDAPVSGAQWGAEAAELVFMVGGGDADVERVRPLLDRMGRAVFHLGGVGAGHAMKCLNNMITAMNLMVLSEGLAIGTRHGLDPAAMVDVLNVSTGMSWVGQTHIHQRVLNRKFDDPFKLALMLKDVGIGMELARGNDVPAPLSGTGHQLWRAAAKANQPDASVSELVRWVESITGVEIRSPEAKTETATPARRGARKQAAPAA
ncbi:MAG: NAD(P)-dependent oxidoreductase [Pigmentiphaga sp.]|nr:NAD(P)-dependent oxidoreductase [Pigmentiphaga sp.]